MQYIGVTERGDAGLDLSWADKLYDTNIIITKNVNDKFIDKVLKHKDKIILHITCTGFGGTLLEPNVPSYKLTLAQTMKLIKLGFPVEQIVLRIDPIIPTEKGIKLVDIVLGAFDILDIKRVRYSFLDMYPHVKERFKQAGIPVPYNSFTAPKKMIDNALQLIIKYEDRYEFESCAENTPHKTGCISEKDLEILGKNIEIVPGGLQRKGCLCLGNKKELLNNRGQCWHGCIYCYWK